MTHPEALPLAAARSTEAAARVTHAADAELRAASAQRQATSSLSAGFRELRRIVMVLGAVVFALGITTAGVAWVGVRNAENTVELCEMHAATSRALAAAHRADGDHSEARVLEHAAAAAACAQRFRFP